jgi:hypothetical protein
MKLEIDDNCNDFLQHSSGDEKDLLNWEIKDNRDDFLEHISSIGQANIEDDECRTEAKTVSEDVGQGNIEADEKNNELKTVETNDCEERKPPFDCTKGIQVDEVGENSFYAEKCSCHYVL